MGQITYKAFGKKFQNPGAVITALTFLWAWREDGNHHAIEQYKQSCRDERRGSAIEPIWNFLYVQPIFIDEKVLEAMSQNFKALSWL